MRTLSALFLALLLPLLGLFNATPLFAAERELVILNWSDYLDPELVKKFEAQHDARVVEIYYESDEQRSQMLVNNQAAGYDLILTSAIDLPLYVKRGWVAPIDPQAIPNLQHLSPKWRSAFPYAESHGVPYFWGTVGILYRSDLVQEPITRWRQLFQPAEELRGRIGMIADGRDLVGMALKSLGYSINSGDQDELAEVEQLLLAQRPHVKTYHYLGVDERSQIVSGDIVAAMAYNGDAVMVQAHHEGLVYVVPEEGTNVWVDYFTLGAQARDPALALKFLDFINEPAHAAQMAEHVYFATANSAAEQLLPAAFRANRTIYPGAAVLARSEFYQALAPRAMRRRNAIGAQILR